MRRILRQQLKEEALLPSRVVRDRVSPTPRTDSRRRGLTFTHHPHALAPSPTTPFTHPRTLAHHPFHPPRLTPIRAPTPLCSSGQRTCRCASAAPPRRWR